MTNPNTIEEFEKAMYDMLSSGTGVVRINSSDMYRCKCWYEFPASMGARGCPNCCGDGLAKLTPMPSVKPYGCHNRAPIKTVCAPTCQYTYSALGQADQRCHGCKERVA